MTDVSIKCFLVAAETGSFSKAADRLFMTRQGVSRQMLKLEKELGCVLFSREPSSVTLTEAGHLYNELFSGFEKQFQSTSEQVRRLNTANRPKVMINAIKGLDLTEYLRNITACLQGMGDVDCLISFHEPHELETILAGGGSDLIISYGEADRPSALEYNSVIIDRVGTFLAVSKNHPKVGCNSPADFNGEEFASWRRRNESDDELITNTSRTAETAGFTIGKITIYPNMESAFTAIELGKAVGVCSANSTLVRRPGIITIPLEGGSNVVCFWKKSPSDAIVKKIIGVMSAE